MLCCWSFLRFFDCEGVCVKLVEFQVLGVVQVSEFEILMFQVLERDERYVWQWWCCFVVEEVVVCLVVVLDLLLDDGCLYFVMMCVGECDVVDEVVDVFCIDVVDEEGVGIDVDVVD